MYHTAKSRFGHSLESPLKPGAPRGGGAKKAFQAEDDRPITPMRDQMIYDDKNSSLDFKDGKCL